VILRDVTLQVQRGDHVAVVGLNGAGKSTLLKGISGALPPRSGRQELGPGVEVALFAQHVVEALDPADTVYRSLENAAHREVLPQEILDLAGSLLFSGDDVRKPISILSGGEKSRVALGRVLLQKAPCLVLDEPTNHLDFQTVEALTRSLQAYSGTVIVVSHDRGFIRRVGTKILEVSRGGVRLYPGTYEEYVWSLQQGLEENSSSVSGKAPGKSDRSAPKAGGASQPLKGNWKEEKKVLERELRICEKRLRDCEGELASLQAETEDLNRKISAAAIPPMDLVQALSSNGERLQKLEALWLDLAEERERRQEALDKMKATS
jgi:ATP-binding cassette, subfamily F, member 3